MERFYPPLPKEIHTISGKVTEKGDNFLMMEAQIRVSQFPLPEGKEIEKRNVKVDLTDKTKIFKKEKVVTPTPEEPFKEIVLSLKDIKVRDEIAVTSEENIKGKTEISAGQIEIRGSLPLILTPTP